MNLRRCIGLAGIVMLWRWVILALAAHPAQEPRTTDPVRASEHLMDHAGSAASLAATTQKTKQAATFCAPN